jgi:hypothetical protein
MPATSRQAPVPITPSEAEVLPRLEMLAKELAQAGLAVTTGGRNGTPYVQAHHPDAPALGERFTIEHHQVDSAAYWFYGSRTGPIGPARNVRAVVTRVTALLAPQVPHLKALATAAEARGLRARLVEPIGRAAFVRISNPDAADLAEDIGCAEGWFRWSWDEPLAPLSGVDHAAAAVARVLGPEARCA